MSYESIIAGANTTRRESRLWLGKIKWKVNGESVQREVVLSAKDEATATEMLTHRTNSSQKDVSIRVRDLGNPQPNHTYYSGEPHKVGSLGNLQASQKDSVIIHFTVSWGVKAGMLASKQKLSPVESLMLTKLSDSKAREQLIRLWADEYMETCFGENIEEFFSKKLASHLNNYKEKDNFNTDIKDMMKIPYISQDIQDMPARYETNPESTEQYSRFQEDDEYDPNRPVFKIEPKHEDPLAAFLNVPIYPDEDDIFDSLEKEPVSGPFDLIDDDNADSQNNDIDNDNNNDNAMEEESDHQNQITEKLDTEKTDSIEDDIKSNEDYSDEKAETKSESEEKQTNTYQDIKEIEKDGTEMAQDEKNIPASVTQQTSEPTHEPETKPESTQEQDSKTEPVSQQQTDTNLENLLNIEMSDTPAPEDDPSEFPDDMPDQDWNTEWEEDTQFLDYEDEIDWSEELSPATPENMKQALMEIDLDTLIDQLKGRTIPGLHETIKTDPIVTYEGFVKSRPNLPIEKKKMCAINLLERCESEKGITALAYVYHKLVTDPVPKFSQK